MTTTSIQYLKGDATAPIGDGRKIIVHVCNDEGKWGSGFVVALSNKWKKPEQQYRQWHRSQNGFKLGAVQFVKVEDNLVIANMIGQHKIRYQNGVAPVRYGAIGKALDAVGNAAVKNNASVHGPKFGSDRAGGDWDKIEQLIIEKVCAKGVDVTIYTL